MEQMQKTTFYTPEEVAKIIQVHSWTVRRWCGEGIFPNAQKIARRYRIPKEDFESWYQSTFVVHTGNREVQGV